MIILCIFFLWAYNVTRYTIYVELIRQVGEPFNETTKDKNGNLKRELRINYRSQPFSGRLYDKKVRGGGYKEHFQVKGTTWDYENYYPESSFYFRTKSSPLDFKTRGIKLFMDPEKGLVPLLLGNPGFHQANTSLNEVIGAICDTMYERDQLYGQDFWSKYGNMLTIAFLTTFLIIGMILVLKFQDISWEHNMAAMQMMLDNVKQAVAPSLP